MLELFLTFWSFREPNVKWVVIGSIILGFTTGIIGTFAFIRKKSLIGDALAHAALPGITTAFILFQTKAPLVILSGALISCTLGLLGVEYISKYTKIKEDSALAIILSFFFGIGLFHLSYIQKMKGAQQAGIDKILFGQAASLTVYDIKILLVCSFVILTFVTLCFTRLKYLVFDPIFYECLGLKKRLLEYSLSMMMVVSVVIGLQMVGVVLMAALLLTPASSARYWSDNFKVILILAGLFGALSGLFGANISYMSMSMPTGPWIVMSLTFIFFISICFAPRRGILTKVIKRIKFSKKINEENLLRSLYKIYENNDSQNTYVHINNLFYHRNFKLQGLQNTLKQLAKKNLLLLKDSSVLLTEMGIKEASNLTRYHRLWELYLSKNLKHPPSLVHDDAEFIEHLITPELKILLDEELNENKKDPHGKNIPEK